MAASASMAGRKSDLKDWQSYPWEFAQLADEQKHEVARRHEVGKVESLGIVCLEIFYAFF